MEVRLPRRAARAACATFVLLLAVAGFARADDAKVLRVATSGDYAPFSFSSSPGSPAADGSDLAGFDIEVARLFARERGYRLEFLRFRWPDLGKELAAGSFDVAMGGITLRPERSISGRYSVPVVATHAVALTWKGSGSTTLAELDKAGHRVFVNAGGHLERVADQAFRRAQVHPVADNDAVRMALLDRACDAVVTDDIEQKVWTAGARGVVTIGPLSSDRKAYLLPAARGDLEAELDRWLIAKEKDGTLARLRAAAFGDGEAGNEATATPEAAFASAVAERQALMPMVWAAKRKAGKPVEDKAQEAAVLESALAALAAAAAAQGQPAPDAASARLVFEQLIVLGKDAQQVLADRDERRRPGTVQNRSVAAPAVGAVPPPSPANGAATAPAAPEAGAAPADKPRDPSAPREYDLGADLRPAISRITDKIARTMLAMEPATSSTKFGRALNDQLTEGPVKSERIQPLIDALVVWSSRRPFGKP